MTPTIEHVTSLLATSAALLDQLEGASTRMRDSVVACRTADLPQLSAEVEALISRIQEVEASRAAALAALLPNEARPSVTALIAQAPQETREALTDLRDRVRRSAEAVARLNRLNDALCHQALDHLNGFFRVLTTGAEDEGTYTRRGGAAGYAPRPLVMRQA